MTVKQEAMEVFRQCKASARQGVDTIPYLSGSKRKLTMLSTYAQSLRDDMELDKRLGVLDESGYDLEARALGLFDKALEHYSVF